jgi:hypothetical protein
VRLPSGTRRNHYKNLLPERARAANDYRNGLGSPTSQGTFIMTNQNNDQSRQQNQPGRQDQQKSGQQAGQQQAQHSKTQGSQGQSGEANRGSGANPGKSNLNDDHGNKR